MVLNKAQVLHMQLDAGGIANVHSSLIQSKSHASFCNAASESYLTAEHCLSGHRHFRLLTTARPVEQE